MPAQWKRFWLQCAIAGLCIWIAAVVRSPISIASMIVCLCALVVSYWVCCRHDEAEEYMQKLREIERIADPYERLRELQKLKAPWERGHAEH